MPTTKPNPIPEGYSTVTPYLCVVEAARLIEFLKQAFAAKVIVRMDGPDGSVMHAEVKIGDSMVMIGQVPAERATRAMLHLYLPDADATYKKALAAGATSVREMADQFYGDRTGGVRDAFGNDWYIATHIEDVSPEEMKRRMAAQATSA
jgi:PhnB protein